MEVLSGTQLNVLNYIRKHMDRGYPPSMQDIAGNIGISPSVVSYHLDQLEKKGYVTREPNKARSIRIVGDARTPDELADVLFARFPRLADVYSRDEVIAAFEKQAA